jgi:hypothetical protein
VDAVSGTAIYFLLVASRVAVGWRLLRWGEFREALGRLGKREPILLMIGSAVLTGRFSTGQNLGYRGIYVLLVLPGVLGAARDATDLRARRLFIGVGVIIRLLMWEECCRIERNRLLGYKVKFDGFAGKLGILVWLAREIAWPGTVTVMAAVVADFLARSEVLAWTTTWLRPAAAQPARPRRSIGPETRHGGRG